MAVPSLNSPKPVSMNGPKVPPPLHKKTQALEQMKEELRKKQEMLDQKWNDFRCQLDKLGKQVLGTFFTFIYYIPFFEPLDTIFLNMHFLCNFTCPKNHCVEIRFRSCMFS